MTVQQCCDSSQLQLRRFRKTGASVFLRRQDTFIGPMTRSDATENSDAPEVQGIADQNFLGPRFFARRSASGHSRRFDRITATSGLAQ
jgi:hypothetical protein